ncbi:MAG: penicillin-binding protein, partial [Flavobacteriales bacterium]|nr:penicillin-binding protein [Flavobacteriales bacterium]
ITPDLVTGVWTGAEDRSVRFSRTDQGQGANMALPIYGYYMNKVYADSTINISTGDFVKPEGVGDLDIDCFRSTSAGSNPFEETEETPSWE